MAAPLHSSVNTLTSDQPKMQSDKRKRFLIQLWSSDGLFDVQSTEGCRSLQTSISLIHIVNLEAKLHQVAHELASQGLCYTYCKVLSKDPKNYLKCMFVVTN